MKYFARIQKINKKKLIFEFELHILQHNDKLLYSLS